VVKREEIQTDAVDITRVKVHWAVGNFAREHSKSRESGDIGAFPKNQGGRLGGDGKSNSAAGANNVRGRLDHANEARLL